MSTYPRGLALRRHAASCSRGGASQGRGGERVVLTPKSGRPRRVAISPELVEGLVRHRTEVANEHRESPAALVWPGRNDQPLGRKTPNQLLGRILNRATRGGRIGSGLGVGRQGVVDQPVEVPDRALALGQQATERHHV